MTNFTAEDAGQSDLAVVSPLREIIHYRELLKNLIARDLKVRYRRSVLGFFWTMLNPLLMMIVFTIVFSTIFRFAIENYVIYFLSAYLLWSFLAQSTAASVRSIVDNGGLIRKIYIPKAVFVLAPIGSGLVNFVLALVPLMFIMAVTGQRFSLNLLFLPIPLASTIVLTTGLSFILATVAVYFHDVIELYQQVILTAWFYLTPILYPIDIIPAQFRVLMRLNPMYYLVESFRDPIYYGVLPSTQFLLMGSVGAIFILVIGWWFFSRMADHFVYYV